MRLVTVGLPIVLGILAIVGTLAGTWLGSRGEHRHWLRDQRRQAYLDLVEESFSVVGQEINDEARRDKLHLALSRVLLFGPPEIADSATDLFRASFPGRGEARNLALEQGGAVLEGFYDIEREQVEARNEFLRQAQRALADM